MRARGRPTGFSLVELVLVCAIIGIIGAIALPRFGSTAARGKLAALAGNLSSLQRSIDLYTAEHADRGPATEPGGGATASGNTVIQRLLRKTDDFGNLTGILGPYLQSWPTNPYNSKKTLRVDGAAAGAGTDGWRIDSVTLKIQSDHNGTHQAGGSIAVSGGGAILEAN